MLNQKEILPNLSVVNPSREEFPHDDKSKSIATNGNSSERLSLALNKVRSELRNDKKHLLIEKIKNVVIDMIYYSESQMKINYSDYLSQKLDCNYTYMSNLFSKVEGYTIQNFIITTKIERVKELMTYDELTLTEIAFKLHYSSVAHISNQFKKVTGLSPSAFKASLAQKATLSSNHPTNQETTDAVSKGDESVIIPINSPQTTNNKQEGLQQVEG